jgi:2-keto-4-pentenoate hydratase/2-oxohepta-3-ene-1,7-dioic acid hydratase in catechol pathway
MTVIRPPAIWCVGRNYADHAAELGNDRPERPMIFFKNPASVIGDGDDIVIPPVCEEHGPQVDWEGELALVIGRDARDLDAASALDAISHYAAANDVTARWWQKHGSGGQFCRGKSFDTFCPVGAPVPTSEVGDPSDLAITTRLNGEVVQSGRTSSMLFPVVELLCEISRGTTLLAGTLVLTGTPAGVGAGMNPPRFLHPGDEIEVEIERVGRVRNSVRNHHGGPRRATEMGSDRGGT